MLGWERMGVCQGMGGPDRVEKQVAWTCRHERPEENLTFFQGVTMPRIKTRSPNCVCVFFFFWFCRTPASLKVLLGALGIPGASHTCPENSLRRLSPLFPFLLRISVEPLTLVNADGQ